MPSPRALPALLLSSFLLTACAGGQAPSSATDGAYPRLMRLAQDVERRGDNGTAATLYQRATEQPDAGFDAWQRLGETRLATGDAPGAEQAFQQALGLRPQDAHALLGLGTAQLRLGEAARAEPLLRQAASALSSASAYNRLAIANVQLGRLPAAQAAFTQASEQAAHERAASELNAQGNLALIQALVGETRKALRTLGELDRAATAMPHQQRNALLVHVLAGQRDAQLQAVRLAPQDEPRRATLIAEARRLAAIPDPAARALAVGWNAGP